MVPEKLRSARGASGLTQQQAADRLGVSQPYLALMERGHRRVTAHLEKKLAKVYGLGPIALPLTTCVVDGWNSSSLAVALASVGYPGFRQLVRRPLHNPATILLAAIAAPDVETRVVEALPWLVIEYRELDWDWLMREARVRDLQNRLGFIVSLARQVVDKRGDAPAAAQLRQIEELLDHGRLVREDTLCQDSLSDAERQWLRQNRPAEAVHWNLLTDLEARLLPYAA